MFSSHEYSIVGHSRVAIGRYLGIIAGLFSSVVATILASFFALAVEHGLAESKDYLILPLTSLTFYGVGYFLFDRWGWKLPIVRKVFNLPYVGGNWDCSGQTIQTDNGKVLYEWSADIKITQRWEKLSICIETSESRSHSVAASIIKKESGGAILMYSYRNEPKAGKTELNSHLGYSEWHFPSDMLTAEATYINGFGRSSSGRMVLSKKEY